MYFTSCRKRARNGGEKGKQGFGAPSQEIQFEGLPFSLSSKAFSFWSRGEM